MNNLKENTKVKQLANLLQSQAADSLYPPGNWRTTFGEGGMVSLYSDTYEITFVFADEGDKFLGITNWRE